jgi:hypothetical protein
MEGTDRTFTKPHCPVQVTVDYERIFKKIIPCCRQVKEKIRFVADTIYTVENVNTDGRWACGWFLAYSDGNLPCGVRQKQAVEMTTP